MQYYVRIVFFLSPVICFRCYKHETLHMIWCPTDEEANKYRHFCSMKNTEINAAGYLLTIIVIKLWVLFLVTNEMMG